MPVDRGAGTPAWTLADALAPPSRSQPFGDFPFSLEGSPRLHAAIGQQVIKQSLRTRDANAARIYSYGLSLGYSQLFAANRETVMPAPEIKDILARVGAVGGKKFDIQFDAATGMATRVTTDGTAADNAAAIQAMQVRAAQLAAAMPLAPAQRRTKGKFLLRIVATLLIAALASSAAAAPPPPTVLIVGSGEWDITESGAVSFCETSTTPLGKPLNRCAQIGFLPGKAAAFTLSLQGSALRAVKKDSGATTMCTVVLQAGPNGLTPSGACAYVPR